MSDGPAGPHPMADRFEIRRQLGEGGVGVVYEALDRVRGQLVAIKVLTRASGPDVVRFKQEFRLLVERPHPSLVSLHELVQAPPAREAPGSPSGSS